MPAKRCEKKFSREVGCRKFEEAGYRFTVTRKSILEILENTDTHLSVEDIFQKVQKQCDGVNLTTIYRNLEILQNLNVVLKYDFGDGRARYELVDHVNKKSNHVHLICKVCGRVIDVEDVMCDCKASVQKKLSEKYEFEIEEEIHQFRGVCSFCK